MALNAWQGWVPKFLNSHLRLDYTFIPNNTIVLKQAKPALAFPPAFPCFHLPATTWRASGKAGVKLARGKGMGAGVGTMVSAT